MWYRNDLKRQAKECLKPQYWTAVGVSLIIAIIMAIIMAIASLSGISDMPYSNNTESCSIPVLLSVLEILLVVFLVNPLSVGLYKFFLIMSNRKAALGDVFQVFKEGYGQTVMAMFFMAIFIFLWSLLLIIPGIIKSYSYRMVPFIMAHNPEIGWRRAFQISKTTTQNEKFNIFVLDLSFILWYLLCAVTFGIAYIFFQPYLSATYAQLYFALRKKAINENICTEEELPAI